jgi:hypothetical protein
LSSSKEIGSFQKEVLTEPEFFNLWYGFYKEIQNMIEIHAKNKKLGAKEGEWAL